MKSKPQSPGAESTKKGSNSAVELKKGSVWSLASLIVVSGGGFAFWIFAASTSPDGKSVGVAAAWFTLMQLTMTVVALGVPVLINRTGHEAEAPAIAGMAVVGFGIVGLVLGFFAPLLASNAWDELSGVSGLALGPLIAFGVVGSGLTLAADARFISLRRWSAVFWRAAIPVFVRLPLLFVNPLEDRSTWLTLLVVVPLALSGFTGLFVLMAERQIVLSSPRGLRRDLAAFWTSEHLSAVAVQVPYHVIPLLVALRVAGPTNAAFYLIWSIGVMAALLPQTLSQVLLSETSLEESGRLSRIRLTLAANLAMAVLVWLATVLLGRPILALVGPTYEDISRVLPWIVLASVAWSLTSVCLTEARLAHNARVTTLVGWTLCVLSVGAGLIFIPGRPVWAATFVWLGSNLVAMAVGVISLELGSSDETPRFSS